MTAENLDVEAWSDFAVALAGVAAVLAGLVFVGLSMNLERIINVPGLRGRAGSTTMILVGAVVFCALLLLPDQHSVALGVELIGVGVIEAALLLALSVSGLRLTNRQPLSWRVTGLVTGQLAALPAVAAGFLILADQSAGLHVLAAGIVWSIVISTTGAWVMVVEVVNDDRYRPKDDSR